MAEPQPVFNDDGSLSGYTLPLEDGSVAVYGADGDLLGAAAAGGQWYDVDELEADDQGTAYADDEDAYAEPFEQRLADLEQRATEPSGYAPYPVAAAPDPAVQQADFYRQMAHEQAKQGRPYTHAEVRAIGRELTEAQTVGEDRIDVAGAIARLHERGEGPPNIDAGSVHQQRANRQQLMTDLYADQGRAEQAERGEDDLMADQPPPSLESYNLDDRAERSAYMQDRLRGATDSSAAYSGSDLETESQEGSP